MDPTIVNHSDKGEDGANMRTCVTIDDVLQQY